MPYLPDPKHTAASLSACRVSAFCSHGPTSAACGPSSWGRFMSSAFLLPCMLQQDRHHCQALGALLHVRHQNMPAILWKCFLLIGPLF